MATRDDMRYFAFLYLVLSLALVGLNLTRADWRPPVIVFFMGDDLGHADVGYNGGLLKPDQRVRYV